MRRHSRTARRRNSHWGSRRASRAVFGDLMMTRPKARGLTGSDIYLAQQQVIRERIKQQNQAAQMQMKLRNADVEKKVSTEMQKMEKNTARKRVGFMRMTDNQRRQYESRLRRRAELDKQSKERRKAETRRARGMTTSDMYKRELEAHEKRQAALKAKAENEKMDIDTLEQIASRLSSGPSYTRETAGQEMRLKKMVMQRKGRSPQVKSPRSATSRSKPQSAKRKPQLKPQQRKMKKRESSRLRRQRVRPRKPLHDMDVIAQFNPHLARQLASNGSAEQHLKAVRRHELMKSRTPSPIRNEDDQKTDNSNDNSKISNSDDKCKAQTHKPSTNDVWFVGSPAANPNNNTRTQPTFRSGSAGTARRAVPEHMKHAQRVLLKSGGGVMLNSRGWASKMGRKRRERVARMKALRAFKRQQARTLEYRHRVRFGCQAHHERDTAASPPGTQSQSPPSEQPEISLETENQSVGPGAEHNENSNFVSIDALTQSTPSDEGTSGRTPSPNAEASTTMAVPDSELSTPSVSPSLRPPSRSRNRRMRAHSRMPSFCLSLDNKGFEEVMSSLKKEVDEQESDEFSESSTVSEAAMSVNASNLPTRAKSLRVASVSAASSSPKRAVTHALDGKVGGDELKEATGANEVNPAALNENDESGSGDDQHTSQEAAENKKTVYDPSQRDPVLEEIDSSLQKPLNEHLKDIDFSRSFESLSFAAGSHVHTSNETSNHELPPLTLSKGDVDAMETSDELRLAVLRYLRRHQNKIVPGQNIATVQQEAKTAEANRLPSISSLGAEHVEAPEETRGLAEEQALAPVIEAAPLEVPRNSKMGKTQQHSERTPTILSAECVPIPETLKILVEKVSLQLLQDPSVDILEMLQQRTKKQSKAQNDSNSKPKTYQLATEASKVRNAIIRGRAVAAHLARVDPIRYGRMSTQASE